MPNWSYNFLTVTGKAKDLKDFLTNGLYGYTPIYKPAYDGEKISERVLERTMNKAVPVPQEVLGQGYSKAGYDWQIENWGTKWDFSDMEDNGSEEQLASIDDDTITKLHYSYETAWSPNEKWLKIVGLKFPKLLFEMSYEEEAGFYAGGFAVKGGREVYRHDYEDMIVYKLKEADESKEEVIHSRCSDYEWEDEEEALEEIMGGFENAILLNLITKEEIESYVKSYFDEENEEVA